MLLQCLNYQKVFKNSYFEGSKSGRVVFQKLQKQVGWFFLKSRRSGGFLVGWFQNLENITGLLTLRFCHGSSVLHTCTQLWRRSSRAYLSLWVVGYDMDLFISVVSMNPITVKAPPPELLPSGSEARKTSMTHCSVSHVDNMVPCFPWRMWFEHWWQSAEHGGAKGHKTT